MIATPAKIASVELLSFKGQSIRADHTLHALTKPIVSAGVKVTTSSAYQGGSDLLILWGPGAPDRFRPMERQVESGGHVACFDLAYWQRDRKVRVSIDRAHPQAWVMTREWPVERLMRDAVALGNLWNPDGPVLVAGLGDKARVQYGAGTVDAWEASILAECRRRNVASYYRAKKAATPPIDQALRGISLVATWHSNVAVDAIRMGIPVVCRDGAAAAVCPNEWAATPKPLSPDVRATFLANLAWFQWDLSTEAASCWAFLQELLA